MLATGLSVSGGTVVPWDSTSKVLSPCFWDVIFWVYLHVHLGLEQVCLNVSDCYLSWWFSLPLYVCVWVCDFHTQLKVRKQLVGIA